MSEHQSIFCESISCVLFSLSEDCLNKKVTNEYFLDVVRSYLAVTRIYLDSVRLRLMKVCCKEHLIIFQEEIKHVEYLLEILNSDGETIKDTFLKSEYWKDSNKVMVH